MSNLCPACRTYYTFADHKLCGACAVVGREERAAAIINQTRTLQAAAKSMKKSDGSTASYYELPKLAYQLQDLISHRNMNAQMGEIFRACYRYGLVEHSEMMRDAKKIKFYAEAEIARLELLEQKNED